VECAVKVYLVYRIVDGELVDQLPCQLRKSGFGPHGLVVGALTNQRAANEPALPANYRITIQLGDGPKAQVIEMPIEPFISVTDMSASFLAPLSFWELETARLRLREAISEPDAGSEAGSETDSEVDIDSPPPAGLDPKQARAWRLKQGRAKARAEERA